MSRPTRTRARYASPFAALLPLAGWWFFPLAFVARLPLAMMTIGAMTLVAESTGSYATGGLAAALVGIGSAAGGPAMGYLADRFGQGPVLVPAALAQGAALIGLVWAGTSGAGPVAIVLASLLVGLFGPPVGPLARVRWMAMTAHRPDGKRELSAALSYESTVDELGFVLGPALVGLLASLVAPWLPLAIAAVVTAVLVPMFAVHPTAHHGHVPGQVRPRAADWTRSRLAAVVVCVLGMVSMGAFFGSTAAGTIAFAGSQGDPSAGGLLYAALGLTSAVAALSVAFWPTGWPHSSRWLVCAVLLVPAALLLQLPTETVPMVLALLVAGLPVGPTLVTIFSLGGEFSPAGRLGTVMTLLSSGIVVGTSIGNLLAGVFAETGGFAGAFMVSAGAAAALAACAIAAAAIRARRLRGGAPPAG